MGYGRALEATYTIYTGARPLSNERCHEVEDERHKQI